MALFFENDSFIPHLRKLLLHNILPAKRLAADFVDATNATALSGENFLVLQNPLRVNGIPLAVADIKVSNGVVHIVDDVLAPSWVFSSLQSRIAEDAELSVLFSFMNIIGLNIGNLGEYTFLAPTNDAFLALPDETMATLTDVDNPSSVVGQFLLYHIIKGVHTLPDFLPSRLETFQGGVVTVSINPTRFNGVTVAEGDILANNGALHKINRVLFKENGVKGDTALDFVADNPNFSTLFGALQRSGFDAALTQPASLTFFAPNNQAFNKLPASLLSTLFFNDEFVPHLQDLLLYHILGSEVLSSGFVDGTAMNALNSEAVIMRTGPLAVNSNRLLAFGDVSNGVVHNIGGVLTPSWIFNSITDLVVSSSSLSTLSNLMVLGGVSLSGAGAYTLLAPTNTAFTAMGVQALQELTDPDKVDLRLAFLAKHVVLGVYTTFQLTAGLKLPNILGTGVTITSINTVLLDDVAFVVFSNALADNGVIHVIDTVLDPEA
jgi:transforming growth factor-beta-induced protein